MSSMVSMAVRMIGVHGSAPKMPMDSDDSRVSSPCRCISSAIASKYDGVTMMMSGRKSLMSCTCFAVCPPDIGTTVQPSFSAP